MYIQSFKLIAQSMLKKSPENADRWTDGQSDGHCHGIICLFFKRAYKKGSLVTELINKNDIIPFVIKQYNCSPNQWYPFRPAYKKLSAVNTITPLSILKKNDNAAKINIGNLTYPGEHFVLIWAEFSHLYRNHIKNSTGLSSNIVWHPMNIYVVTTKLIKYCTHEYKCIPYSRKSI